MNTDRSSKAYIATIQAQNIIASVANGTPGGTGFQGALTLGKIDSVINAPPEVDIMPPTDLTYDVLDASNNEYALIWMNVATGITDTLVELYINGVWILLDHSPLGDALCIPLVLTEDTQVRVSSVTATGTSVASDPFTIIIPPTNLSGSKGPSMVSISWRNNTVNITETIIEINNGAGWVTQSTSVGNRTSFMFVFSSGQIRVRTTTAAGTSIPSNVITI